MGNGDTVKYNHAPQIYRFRTQIPEGHTGRGNSGHESGVFEWTAPRISICFQNAVEQRTSNCRLRARIVHSNIECENQSYDTIQNLCRKLTNMDEPSVFE